MPGFIMTLIVAAVAGLIGDALVKDIPGDFWGAMLAGLLGAWIGAYFPYFTALGPVVGGIAIVPTALGAAVFVFLLGLVKSIATQTR